jgi:polygalacturonase
MGCHSPQRRDDMVRAAPASFAALLCLLVITPSGAAVDVDWAEAERITAGIQQPAIPARQIKVTRFGAIAGGRKDARPAILSAIHYMVRRGGGRVVVPRGLWFVKGPIVLQSRIELHLESGARLLFSAHPVDFLPPVKIRWEGVEVQGYAPLIYAKDVEDVAITGKGVIDGNAKSHFLTWEASSQPDIARVRRMAFEDTPFEQRVFGEGAHLRPSAIEIVGGKRVRLEGYTVRNASFWVNHLVYVDHATVRGIRVESKSGEAQQHNDGVDIDSSTNILIERSVFRCGNYAVAVKSGRDADGRRIGRSSANIVIHDNDLGGGDGIGFGSEMSGGIRDVYIENNVMRDAGAAFHFKSTLERGGFIENIHVRNLAMGRYQQLIWLQLGKAGEMGGINHPASVRNITFERLAAKSAEDALIVEGPAAQPVSNIILKGVHVEAGRARWSAKNVESLELHHVVFGSTPLDLIVTKQ